MTPLIVTIDGPAGVGKTTLAKRLAARLGVAYLDTGAMYRAIALALAQRLGPEPWERPEAELAPALAGMAFGLSGSGPDTALLLAGRPLGDELRTEEVARWASNVAKLPAVRTALTAAQRAMGHSTPLVAEGRDMGTVVFPQAARKFFLDASAAERASRRALQLRAMGQQADEAAILAQIQARDAQDRNRSVAPLRAAPDALVIDTTSLGVDQVFAAMVRALEG